MEMNEQFNSYIKNKLVELESSFDFSGMDKLVYAMCITDFSTYCKYIHQNHLNINPSNEFSTYFDIDTLLFTINDINNDRLTIEAWTEWWFKKYKQRVKLTFTENLSPTQLNNNILSKFTDQEIDEIKEAMRFKLIEKGDICGTMIIVDSMFLKILSQYSDKIDWNISAKLILLNTMLKEMHKVAFTKGVLIFIKPNKQGYINEYRNDGTTAVKQ
jgi:hypothetical protein